MIKFEKPQRPVERVFIHCSASNRPAHDDVSVIHEWHKARWPEACKDYCGYHFYIKTDGTLQEGRDLELKPVAQGGHNSHTIAICLNGLNESDFTEAQFKTLRYLCDQIFDAYNGAVTFHGHCEVSIKSCPVFNYTEVLNLDAFGRLDGKGSVALPTVKVKSRGTAVRHLQRLLGLSQDGIFGPNTEKAVKAFQESEKLVADGIVGPATWAAIAKLK
tara:strand:- start:1306 stop:1956 length:651 start_codon:yes stop_codon:yes gene_type:complete